jgi:hypothetical protein
MASQKKWFFAVFSGIAFLLEEATIRHDNAEGIESLSPRLRLAAS